MNPLNTNEKRKSGLCSIWGGISVALVLFFELAYLIAASLPDDALYSQFSPQMSAEDRLMLEANIPGAKPAKESVKEPEPAPESVTAVDAAMEKAKLATRPTRTNEVPRVLTGADDVQWQVADTNEFKRLIASSNAVTEAAMKEVESLISSTNRVPAVTSDEDPESAEPIEKITVPVG